MKYFFYCYFFLFMASCSQEKMITKTTDEALIKSNNSESKVFVSGVNNSPSLQIPGTRLKTNQELLVELYQNGIPKSLPTNDFPSWREFDVFYTVKREKLSNGARQFCSELLLRSYKLQSTKYNPQQVKNVVVSNVQFLAEHEYLGFELLYNYLNWMKENGFKEYIGIKSLVIKYASISINKKDQSKQDDPFITSNPTLKKRMDEIIIQMQKDDEYIAKIQAL